MPISFRLRGTFHNIAAFAADIAQNQRVVHLHDLAIANQPDGALTVDGTLRIYRHLDKAETATSNLLKKGNT
jgi:type IV pilus assembly protein PilO